jgi:hypothetical protein
MTDITNEPHQTRKEKQEDRIVQKVLELVKSQFTQPANPSSGLKPDELTRFMRFMESAKVIAASALLTAMSGAIYEYFALMGVADVSPARVVLLLGWFFGSLFVWEVVRMFPWKGKKSASVICAGIVLLAVGFVGLDHWTVLWKLRHPPDVAELRAGLQNITMSVQRLTDKSDTSAHVTRDQPQIKEIKSVAGYLKLVFGYPRLPVEQPNKAASINALYFNLGSTYVHDATMNADLFYVDFNGVQAPLHPYGLEAEVKGRLAKKGFTGTADIAPGDAIFNSFDTSVLTEKMVEDIRLGTARIYFAAHVEWTSVGSVPDHVNTCLWLQPSAWSEPSRADVSIDPKKDEPVWHNC